MTDLAITFGTVFVAEMGDKTQLVVLSMATRHRAAQLLGVLVVAIVALQALSVSLGALAGSLVPGDVLGVVVGVMFLGFAGWTWRMRRASGGSDDAEPSSTGRSLLLVGVAFFVAELGDKTMLTTAGLATERAIAAVWVGSFLAMVAAVVVALVAGRTLLRRITPTTLHTVSAVLFAALGLVTLAGVILG